MFLRNALKIRQMKRIIVKINFSSRKTFFFQELSVKTLDF